MNQKVMDVFRVRIQTVIRSLKETQIVLLCVKHAPKENIFLSTDGVFIWINARWDTHVNNSYRVTLAVTCMDRVGMLADLSAVIANMHVMIHSIFTKDSTDGRSTIYMTITVNGAEHLKNVCEKLRKIKGVLTTERSGL